MPGYQAAVTASSSSSSAARLGLVEYMLNLVHIFQNLEDCYARFNLMELFDRPALLFGGGRGDSRRE